MSSVRRTTRRWVRVYPLVWVDGKAVPEHRWVWEQAHGPLPSGVVIHHRNEDPTDNRLENLQAMPAAEHVKLHRRLGSIRQEQHRSRLRTIKPSAPFIADVLDQLERCPTCIYVEVDSKLFAKECSCCGGIKGASEFLLEHNVVSDACADCRRRA